jgi:hypothetical protein
MKAWQRYLRNEARTIACIGKLVRGRRDIAPGGTGIGYVKALMPMLIVFSVVTLIEAALFTLVDFGFVFHLVLLVLELYSVLLMLGYLAAMVVRPHTVGPRELRVRNGAFLDVAVPLAQVQAVHRRRRNHNDRHLITLADGEFRLVLNAETNVEIELREPITVTRPLGKTGTASVLKFYADDPDAAVAAIRVALGESATA